MIAGKKVLFALIIAVAPSLFAELAPEVYEEMQREAPEVLQVEITSVEVDREFRKPSGCRFFEVEISRHVTAKAKVVAVTRSRTGVRPGTAIEIPYISVRRCSGFTGPRPIPLLSKGEKVYAYLAKGDRGFEPAARGASFSAERPK
ncbi:MAG TPA: hypothetical protein VEK57_03190 [Thermoanaerobaculia bacterium]|nr:hypothetical protein [Thermoanaerobaculia bacterium]